MRVTGLGRGLSDGLARWRAPRAVHDPGKVIADLAAAVALGGDCLADIAVLREQPDLAGPVASDPVVSRLVRDLAADLPRALKAIRAARAAAREHAWALGGDAAPGADGGLVTVDLDATIVIAHSEKQQAAPTWKKTFGFHPMTVWADHGQDGNGEPLAIMLRPGNAGSNTAADHIVVLDAALAQLPAEFRDRECAQPLAILARSDSAGATHAFAAALRTQKIRFSLGYPVDERVGQAAVALPRRAWKRAVDGEGDPRRGAWVAELTGRVELSAWPEGTRLIVRKERPHPGAQLRFTDLDGHRFQCFITDQAGGKELALLERRHRFHARVEDRIQESQELGLGRLPFQTLAPNQAWFELALLAQDLLAWLRQLALSGELKHAKPKRLRGRLLHIAGRITRSGRQRTLHLPHAWPWAHELLAALARVRALTTPG
jgi:hypothetical protein